MASSDAKPIPVKNAAYRVTFPIYDADGDLVTGATGLDSEVSKDAGTFADCTNEATEIATSSGVYYLDLTSTEMNADTVCIIVKTSTSGAKTTVVVLNPQEAGDVNTTVEGYASGQVPLQPTTAGRTLDVTATGAAGIDWGNVENPTTTLNLSGTTISTSQAVASVSGAVGSVTGNVGGNVVGSVGSISGITFPGNFAALGINASGHVSRVTLTDTLTTYTGNTPQTGDSYARIGATGSGLTSLAPAATALSTATWTATRAGYLDNLSGGAVMLAASYSAPPSAATIADAVWDEAISGHSTSGSTGEALSAAGSAGDPWSTALPGAYSAGSAGYIIGTNLNATVSSRSSHSAADVWAVATRTLSAFSFTVNTSDAASIAAILEDTGTTIPAQIGALSIPSAATNASAVRTELATELARIDVATSTRLASASYATPLDAAGVRSAVGLASANLDTQLADIPTVSEFNARTLATADYATATALAVVDGIVDDILVDTGTTIPAQIGGLSIPSAASNASAVRTELSVELARIDVATSTRLSSAGYTAPDNASITAILEDTGTTIPAQISGLSIPSAATNASAVRTEIATELARIDVATSTRLASASYTAPLDAAGTRSAIGLASANLDTQLADMPTVSEFEARTILAASYALETTLTSMKGATFDTSTDSLEALRNRGDAAWTTATGFSTLDAAGVRSAVGLASANLDTQLDNVPTVAEFEARTLAAADYATATALAVVDGIVDDIQVDTGTTIPAQISALSIPTTTQVADAVLSRNMSNVEGSAGEHTLCTLVLAGLESSVSGTTWTIKRTDGTTTHATKTVATDANADPITGVS